MIDVVTTLIVFIAEAIVLAVIRSTLPRQIRNWVWFAFAEYIAAAIAQLIYGKVIVHGGDMALYAETGTQLGKALDRNFEFAAHELMALLFQRSSIFDSMVYGGGHSNTGSMHAIITWIMYFCGGSEYAAHFFVSALGLCGTLGIFKAFIDAYPEGGVKRLFIATVVFPSTAFWVSAFHKETFGIFGIGLALVGWRYADRLLPLRAAMFLVPGIAFIYLFRAPALAPILMGLVVFFVVDRARRTRGPEATVIAPGYFILALVVLAVGMLAITRLNPALGLDRLGESVSSKQRGWSGMDGGSNFGSEEMPTTLAGQLLRVPLALFNALFRPQLFDVHNFGALLSALEMTTISVIVIQALRRNGFAGLTARVQKSPFLLMCAVVTVVGCAFVGLVTWNFGSLSRYRVPFLPFYGGMLVGFFETPEEVAARMKKRQRGGATRSPLAIALARKAASAQAPSKTETAEFIE